MYNFPIWHIHSCYQRERNTSVMDVIPINPTNLWNISLDLLFQIIKIPCHNGYLHGETITQLHHVLKKKHFDDYPQLQKRNEKRSIKCESEFQIDRLTGLTQECKKTTRKIHFIEKSIQPINENKSNLPFIHLLESTSHSQGTLASFMMPPSSSFFKDDLTSWGKNLKLVTKKLKVYCIQS